MGVNQTSGGLSSAILLEEQIKLTLPALTITDALEIGEIAKWRAPGHFRFCSATSYHRIELDPDVECWTLFIPGPKQRDWGFLVRNKWIQWEQYLATRSSK